MKVEEDTLKMFEKFRKIYKKFLKKHKELGICSAGMTSKTGSGMFNITIYQKEK